VSAGLSEDLRAEAPLWILVMKGTCTLTELETSWSLDDVARAFAVMSAQGCLEQMNMDRMTRKMQGAKHGADRSP